MSVLARRIRFSKSEYGSQYTYMAKSGGRLAAVSLLTLEQHPRVRYATSDARGAGEKAKKPVVQTHQ
jgi:hypothetical protein